MEKLVHGIKIGVDCVIGSGDNIIRYDGFNFIVEEEKKEEMKEFVIQSLNCFEIPYEEIYLYKEGNYKASEIWTKEKIVWAMRRRNEDIKWEYKNGRRI